MKITVGFCLTCRNGISADDRDAVIRRMSQHQLGKVITEAQQAGDGSPRRHDVALFEVEMSPKSGQLTAGKAI